MASPAGTIVQDAVMAFPDGVNMGVSPLLLPNTQLASGTNITVRGTLVTPRPVWRLMPIDFGYPDQSQSDLEGGKYQGGCYYKPDSGAESMMFQLSGRIFQITPGTDSASFIERTIPGDPNSSTPDQAFLWQTEGWVVGEDGTTKNPWFFNQNPAGSDPVIRRSTYGLPISESTTVTTNFTAPAVNASVAAVVGDTTNMAINVVVTIKNFGTFLVQSIVGTTATLVNLTTKEGTTVKAGALITWAIPSTELPPGRMGAYVMGQNWLTLLDGKQFLASDQVGSSSGTVAYNFRDAVLNITQNLYLAGGGNFTVPGTAGEITCMIEGAVLDASLGQGPLQTFTPGTVFSVNVPTDRTTWQNLTNPILSEPVIDSGTTGQWSVSNANSDFIYRSPDTTIRSYAIARRDFNTWGSTPISREVQPILQKDDPGLLPWCSIVVFDNRCLTTAEPHVCPNGIYWRQIVALNFDPISSLRGKAPSVWEGSWVGPNVYQLIKGMFGGVERCFALTYNAITLKNELYELLKQDQDYFDNTSTRIVSAFQTGVLLKEVQGKSQFDLCKLEDGEIYLDGIRGTTDVQVWYKPDSYPCWVQWIKFSICSPMAQDDPNSKPGYRTRIGLGQPPGSLCEPTNNRPYRTGYWFQLRFVITGPYRFLGGRIKASLEPQSQYAKVAGCCENEEVIPPTPGGQPQTLALQFGDPDTGFVFGDPNAGNVFGQPNP